MFLDLMTITPYGLYRTLPLRAEYHSSGKWGGPGSSNGESSDVPAGRPVEGHHNMSASETVGSFAPGWQDRRAAFLFSRSSMQPQLR